jgi:hypothetical protein
MDNTLAGDRDAVNKIANARSFLLTITGIGYTKYTALSVVRIQPVNESTWSAFCIATNNLES